MVILSGQCPELVWSDEFDGEMLDQTKWSYQIGDGCNISPDLCGWGNNELQYYRQENVSVGDGVLKIEARRENFGGRNYTSARIRSIDKGDWTYGRFEARIKLPAGRGLWPAFWMLPTDEVYGGWPQSGEIDIMELIGSEPETVHGTIHFGQPWPNNASSSRSFDLREGGFNDDFHEFAIEWESGTIRWYVDGYCYSTKTRSDVSPNRWPFDQDFHFLLNVAVGGNWPGSPDGNTRFPQAMEIDYVRVYNNPVPSMTGKQLVANKAKGETYTVANAAENATFIWTVPEGAVITAGQGTRSITVDWGGTSGEVTVEVSSSCGNRQLQIDVTVEAAFIPELTLENFDDDARVDYTFSTGTYSDNIDNPQSNEINSSTLCGKYVRNATQQFDVLVYETKAISNANDFINNEKKFYLDVYTDAAPGTLVLLQLENSSRAQPENFPTGRHSRFEAYTSKQNEWERLEFTLLDQPDPATSGTSIDQLILLFASNTRTGNTYHYDNFEVYGREVSTGLFDPEMPAGRFTLAPNPTSGPVQLHYEGPVSLEAIQVTDLTGRILTNLPTGIRTGEILPLDLSGLPAGIYLIKGITKNRTAAVSRVVKQE